MVDKFFSISYSSCSKERRSNAFLIATRGKRVVNHLIGRITAGMGHHDFLFFDRRKNFPIKVRKPNDTD
ncbi:hypothetical protein SAMN04488101_11964 [Pedobacter nyackensis]|uniref:Uncharacterized protein n=1 Tax=Pedobacter nyackensis TaxID=475255 RepID=A0A1W2F418_9SPHI|nr:hypothetical protein SAMN04488101_11964 [Pedobacter nyackensis]